MNHAAIYEASYTTLRTTPGYVEVLKRKSVLMWIINVFLYLPMRAAGSSFMRDFITTIAGRIYWPQDPRIDPRASWRTLWHECMHRRQAIIDGEPRFSLSYMFPQVFAVLALGAIAAIWWTPALLFLLALGFLAPWPAPTRARYEREAYAISIVCDILIGWDVTAPIYEAYQAEHYTGWAYFKMVWNKDKARRWVREDIAWAQRIVSGEARTEYTDRLLAVVRAAG